MLYLELGYGIDQCKLLHWKKLARFGNLAPSVRGKVKHGAGRAGWCQFQRFSHATFASFVKHLTWEEIDGNPQKMDCLMSKSPNDWQNKLALNWKNLWQKLLPKHFYWPIRLSPDIKRWIQFVHSVLGSYIFTYCLQRESSTCELWVLERLTM